MSTDISEKGLETIIFRYMTGTDGLAVLPNSVAEAPAPYGGTGYYAGSPQDYDRTHALDTAQLFAFLLATQPETVTKLALSNDPKDFNRLKFLTRLSSEVGKRGVIDVLRKGIDHGPLHIDLFYGTPSPGNAKAASLHAQNRFSLTRQLAYSTDQTRRALDLGLFINGMPVATFELKNSLTKQTVADAVEQYRRDRDPREPLFAFGRCVVYFAVDDSAVMMSTDSKVRAHGFCRSIWGTTMVRATHLTPLASRRITSGKRSLRQRDSPTFSKTTPRSSRKRNPRLVRRSGNRCGHATTSCGWYGRR